MEVEHDIIGVTHMCTSKDEIISGKIEKKKISADVGWGIDSMESLHTSVEFLDHLFGSIWKENSC